MHLPGVSFGFPRPRAPNNTVQTGSTPATGTTAGLNLTTFIDRSWSITNSRRVFRAGIYSSLACTGNIKIVKRVSAGVYDILASRAFSHTGSSAYEYFDLLDPVDILAAGSYYVGAYFATGSVSYDAGFARSFKGGDVTGLGQSGFTEDTNACFGGGVKF